MVRRRVQSPHTEPAGASGDERGGAQVGPGGHGRAVAAVVPRPAVGVLGAAEEPGLAVVGGHGTTPSQRVRATWSPGGRAGAPPVSRRVAGPARTRAPGAMCAWPGPGCRSRARGAEGFRAGAVRTAIRRSGSSRRRAATHRGGCRSAGVRPGSRVNAVSGAGWRAWPAAQVEALGDGEASRSGSGGLPSAPARRHPPRRRDRAEDVRGCHTRGPATVPLRPPSRASGRKTTPSPARDRPGRRASFHATAGRTAPDAHVVDDGTFSGTLNLAHFMPPTSPQAGARR